MSFKWRIFIKFSTIFALIGIFFAIYYQSLINFMCEKEEILFNIPQQQIKKPKYIIHINPAHESALDHVDTVLQRLGLEKIQTKGLKPSEYPTDWDLFWSFEHHSTLYNEIDFKNTSANQKMNHIPGIGVLVSKSLLATQTNLKYISPAFLTSEEVQKYAKKNPEKRFVVKLKDNRGVKLMKAKDMNFTISPGFKGYFAQEFIENPLLWNGHKFDIGIYVAITSVNPLRVYYYTKEYALRFCLKPYSTDDPEDIHSYVIDSTNLCAQTFNGTAKYVNNNFSIKDAFSDFLRSQGQDVDEIWNKIETMIAEVVMTKERKMVQEIKQSGTQKYSYFDLLRFDMILNDKFELFLLEVNMSPNLRAAPTISLFQHSFESLLFNFFNLLGIGTSYEKQRFGFESIEIEKMVAHPYAFSIKPEICLSDDCINSCDAEVCNVCWKCIGKAEKYEKIQAYREQMNVGDFKRVFPPTKEKFKNFSRELVDELMPDNLKYFEWYSEMCYKNRHFC